MTAQIIDGKALSAQLRSEVAQRAAALTAQGTKPGLAVILVGENPASQVYVRGKVKDCGECGIKSLELRMPETTTQEELLAKIAELAADKTVNGILVQLPLPKQIDERAVIDAIPPEKDVDGAAEGSLAAVYAGTDEDFAPCTAQAVLELLDYYEIPIEGKRAVVLGRSLVVGRPAAMLLLHRGATVTLCHSKTAPTAGLAREADILVAAAGRRESVGAAYFRAGQTVIDVGIHYNEETQKLCGDVALAEADGVVRAVTPVPGGVGALTTAVLAAHTAKAAARRIK